MIMAATGAKGAQSDAIAQVLQRVNAARADKGCGPLVVSDLLTRAAERESRDMATGDFFSHTEPDGTTPGQRVHDTGYVYQMIGENIEADPGTGPDAAFENWMNSPGHRANILTCAFRETGIAVDEQRDDAAVAGAPAGDRVFWTEVFAMPFRTQAGR